MYTPPRAHPFVTFLKLTFFLWVLYLTCKLMWRTTVLVVGGAALVIALAICSVVPPWRHVQPRLVKTLEKTGLYWAEFWT